MKKSLSLLCLICTTILLAQDHFIGVNTSSRVGMLNASLNPAELPNLSKKFEVNIYGLSLNFGRHLEPLAPVGY